MDVRDFIQRMPFWISQLVQLGLHLLWYLLHLLVSIWYRAVDAFDVLESYSISCGLLKRYKTFDVSKLRYLAIVVETDEAWQTSKVIQLLQWVASIGVKHVCLYDMEGVLKKSKETILEKCNAKAWKGVDKSSFWEPFQVTLDFASFSDGKEAIVKAANLLFQTYNDQNRRGGDQEKRNFTEAVLSDALRVVDCSGAEPDLILVYGPARCHLGFPAWRIRYSEIVHMGNLKSMKYGSLVKAIYRFTAVCQNYGT